MDAFLVSIQAQYIARGDLPPRGEKDFERISAFLGGLASDVRSAY